MLYPSNERAASTVAAAAILLAGLIGCGGSGPTLLSSSGTVLLDGRPVEGAAVLFIPTAGGPAASGITDDRGYFRLSTVNTPGAVPGQYRVTVTKQEVPDMYAPARGSGVKWIVPEKYSVPDTSGLTATIDTGDREFDFELSSR